MITKNGLQKLFNAMHPLRTVNLVVKDVKRIQNDKVAARLKLSDEMPGTEPISAIVPNSVWKKVSQGSTKLCNGALIEVRANFVTINVVEGQKILILNKPFKVIPQTVIGKPLKVSDGTTQATVSSFLKGGILSDADAPIPLTKEQMAREKKVIPISHLNDNLKDFMIKVAIVHKNEVRSWKNARGTGHVFNFSIADFYHADKETFEDGEVIQCSIFNDRAIKFSELLQYNTIYFISKALIKQTQFRSSRMKHPYCLVLEEKGIIENEFGETIEPRKNAINQNNQSQHYQRQDFSGNHQNQNNQRPDFSGNNLNQKPYLQQQSLQQNAQQSCQQAKIENTLDKKTDWRELVGIELPQAQFKFVNIKDICYLEQGIKIDFVGIILNIGPVLAHKDANRRQKMKLDLTLGDKQLNCIKVTLWGNILVKDVVLKLVQNGWQFEKRHPVVVVIQNCRISDFQSRSLNVTEQQAAFYINPQTPMTMDMRYWMSRQQDKDLNFQNVADLKLRIFEERKQKQDAKEVKQQMIMNNSRFQLNSKAYMPIREIINHLTVDLPKENFKRRVIQKKTDAFVSDKPLHYQFHIQGHLSGFNLNDQPYYKACPKCQKKFVKQNNDAPRKIYQSGQFYGYNTNLGQNKTMQYECFFCNKFYDNFVPKYNFSARFADFSDEISIKFTSQFGDAVMGCPAEKFKDMKEKAALFSGELGTGTTELSQKILQDVYERLLHQEAVLDVHVSYSRELSNKGKVQYICNGVNWGQRINWGKLNSCLLKRLKAYKSRQDITDHLHQQQTSDQTAKEEEEQEVIKPILSQNYNTSQNDNACQEQVDQFSQPSSASGSQLTRLYPIE